MNAADGGTIVERLQSQRANLVDVLHQIDGAIKTFGGTITPNGNGHTPTNGKTIHWTQRPKNKALLRRTTRKAARARRAKLYQYPTVSPAPVGTDPF